MEEKRVQEDEIDLVELAKIVWSRKWFIGKVTGVFILFGLLIAFTSPKEYATSCTLIPEAMNVEGKLGGSLGGLASLAGIDMGGMSGGSSTINPGLYRSVARSTPFLLELMNQEYYFQELDLKVSLYDYYLEYYKSSLLSKVFSFPFHMLSLIKPSSESEGIAGKDSGLIALTKDQQSIAENLSERILVTMDWELNVVTIEVEMQDPGVAARMTRFTQDYITDYVTQYSISKSKEQLTFVNGQYQERKREFEKAQLALAIFRDQNRNVNTARARSEEERLQSEYNLAFNVYNQLAQQLETIRLQVNENTPVFTVLEPVKVPVNKSSPKRGIIVLSLLLVGVVFGVLLVLIKNITI